MYTRIDVTKPTGGGAAQAKSQDVVILNVNDIQTWPSDDGKGVRLVGDIVMKDGKYATFLQATSSSISLPITSEGDEDAVSFTSVPEFYHPGSSIEFDEFVSWGTNKNLIVGFKIGACDGENPYYKFYGTPCTPLSLLVEGQSNNEATRNMVRFQQFQPSRSLPKRYFGTITFATVNVVAADTTDIDVTAGEGRYQLTDNTIATVITDISNGVAGTVYTLLGSGGTNPATIEATNTSFLLAGAVDWQGLAGSTLTVRAYEQAGGAFTFIEESRT